MKSLFLPVLGTALAAFAGTSFAQSKVEVFGGRIQIRSATPATK